MDTIEVGKSAVDLLLVAFGRACRIESQYRCGNRGHVFFFCGHTWSDFNGTKKTGFVFECACQTRITKFAHELTLKEKAALKVLGYGQKTTPSVV